MKTALILSGHLRTFEYNVNEFNQIVDDYNADVFIETWEKLGFWTDKDFGKKNDLGFEDISDDVTQDDVKNIKNLKYVNIDIYENYKDKILNESLIYETSKIEYVRVPNIISQWYKRWKILNYIKENYIYDFLILTRPDVNLLLSNNINMDVMTLSNAYTSHDGFADILFIGPTNYIMAMGELYPRMSECIKDNVIFSGHSIVKWWIEKNSIPYMINSYNLKLINTPGGYCKK